MKGIFVASTPSRARRRQKGTLAPVITSRSRGVADRNANPGLAGASTRCIARRAAGRSPTFRGSPLGRDAVRPPTTPRPEIRDPPHAGRPLGVRLRTALRIQGDAARITGSSMGAVRRAEIDQHSREIAMRRMSDTCRLSDIRRHPARSAESGVHSARAARFRWVDGRDPPPTAGRDRCHRDRQQLRPGVP